LNLSDDQKAQIRKIHQEAHAKREKVMADSSLSDTAKQEKARAIRRAAMERARGVLTPEQREQLKANRSARRAEGSQPQSM